MIQAISYLLYDVSRKKTVYYIYLKFFLQCWANSHTFPAARETTIQSMKRLKCIYFKQRVMTWFNYILETSLTGKRVRVCRVGALILQAFQWYLTLYSLCQG